MSWLEDLARRVYGQAKGAVQKAGERDVASNALDALKGSAAGFLTGTVGAPADYLSMIPLSPKEGGNPYANAIREFVGDPEKPFMGSQYLADKIGLGGEGLAYDVGQFISPATIKDLMKGAVKSDIFVRPNRVWKDWAEAKKAQGLTPDEIYAGGGLHGPSRMFKGADEQWYQEIPDYGAQFTPKVEQMLRENRNMFDPAEVALRQEMLFNEMEKLHPGRWADSEDLDNYFWDRTGYTPKWRNSSVRDQNGYLNKDFDDYTAAQDAVKKARTTMSGQLRDVLIHPELEKVAPELFDLPTSIKYEYQDAGSFNPASGEIMASAKPYGQLEGFHNTQQNPDLGTLLHEVQHGAQRLFDYGGGGSPENVFRADRTFIDPPSEEMIRKYLSESNPYKPINRYVQNFGITPTAAQANHAYRTIHGEEMARMAENRYTIPPDQLKAPKYENHPSNLIYALPPSLRKLFEQLKGLP